MLLCSKITLNGFKYAFFVKGGYLVAMENLPVSVGLRLEEVFYCVPLT